MGEGNGREDTEGRGEKEREETGEGKGRRGERRGRKGRNGGDREEGEGKGRRETMTKGIVQRGDLWPECVKEWVSGEKQHKIQSREFTHASCQDRLSCSPELS